MIFGTGNVHRTFQRLEAVSAADLDCWGNINLNLVQRSVMTTMTLLPLGVVLKPVIVSMAMCSKGSLAVMN